MSDAIWCTFIGIGFLCISGVLLTYFIKIKNVSSNGDLYEVSICCFALIGIAFLMAGMFPFSLEKILLEKLLQ